MRACFLSLIGPLARYCLKAFFSLMYLYPLCFLLLCGKTVVLPFHKAAFQVIYGFKAFFF